MACLVERQGQHVFRDLRDGPQQLERDDVTVRVAAEPGALAVSRSRQVQKPGWAARRRAKQVAYNEAHGIEPMSIVNILGPQRAGVGDVTVTVASLDAEPPAPEQVSVNVVVRLSAAVTCASNSEATVQIFTSSLTPPHHSGSVCTTEIAPALK